MKPCSARANRMARTQDKTRGRGKDKARGRPKPDAPPVPASGQGAAQSQSSSSPFFDENMDGTDTGLPDPVDETFDLVPGGVTHGQASHDTIKAESGNTTDDTVHAGSGNDSVKTGGGRDTIYANNGNDDVDGGDGDDLIYGQRGQDNLRGGRGNDEIWGGSGGDELYGGRGNDTLRGGSGNDLLYGGIGSDNLAGGSGDDTLHANGGRDHHISQDGSRLHGGDGNDTLYGHPTNGTPQELIGGQGDDDIFSLHPDSDFARQHSLAANTVIYPGPGQDTMTIWGGETVRYGQFDHSKPTLANTIVMNGPDLNLSFQNDPSAWMGVDPITFQWAQQFTGQPGEMMIVPTNSTTVRMMIDLDGDRQPDFELEIQHNGHRLGDAGKRPNIHIDSFSDPSDAPY